MDPSSTTKDFKRLTLEQVFGSKKFYASRTREQIIKKKKYGKSILREVSSEIEGNLLLHPRQVEGKTGICLGLYKFINEIYRRIQ